MKKLKILIIAVLLLTFGLACNLSTYLSDTPPYQPEENSQNPQITETVLPENCLNPEAIPSNFSKVSNLDMINTENISKYIEDAISKIFPDAKIAATEMVLSDNQDQAINCVEISPLTSLEKTTFDLMIKSPDIITQYVSFPNVEIQSSQITDSIQNLGDSRTAYHIEVNGSEIQLEIVIYRKNESVYLVSFLTKGTLSSHDDMIRLASKLN